MLESGYFDKIGSNKNRYYKNIFLNELYMKEVNTIFKKGKTNLIENLVYDPLVSYIPEKFKKSQIELSSAPTEITPPSPEELKRKEKERILAQKRAELSKKFGAQAPYDLTEKEIEKLSDEQVEPLAGRWFLFLREKGDCIEFPESMDGQFSSMMDSSAREYIEREYGVFTQISLDRLLGITKTGLNGQSLVRVIQIAEGVNFQKKFPLGKIYETVPISGLRERICPLEATTLLVYGLIGKKMRNVRAAYQVFEKYKLEAVKKYLQNSQLSGEKVFGEIAQDLLKLPQGDVNAAENILKYLAETLKTEELSDLIEGVRGLFKGELGFSHLDIRMQDGIYEDLFDNSRLMSCTFLPCGKYKEAAIAYHSDPDVGLLHISPRNIDRRLDPIGVSILLNALDENGRKWLVVDSVEGGRELERVREKLWIPAVYNCIVGVAGDVGAYNILFNSKVFNGRAKHFIDYVSKRNHHTTVNLKKDGMADYSNIGIPSSASREAFETWGEGGRNGEANGYVLELQR